IWPVARRASMILERGSTKGKSKMKTNITYTMLAAVGLACLAFPSPTRAVNPPPDGGYSGSNTAEGDFALSALTAGFGNTAVGYQALNKDTGGSYNTATGLEALRDNVSG